MRDDLVGCLALVLMPHHDIEHADAAWRPPYSAHSWNLPDGS
jgi:hypothetical protein